LFVFIMVNKSGAYQYLITSLVLGLIVVGIVFSWIFGEGLTSEDVDFEACRQSIVARNSLPDIEVAGLRTWQFKDDFPLKCKTNVVTIDYEDRERAEKAVLDSMIQCWQMMGNGEYSIFPSASWSTGSYCYNCARIHFAPNVKDYYSESANIINLEGGLRSEFRDGISYRNYLIADEMNLFLAHDSFADDFRVELKTSLTGNEWWSGGIGRSPVVYYPKKIDVSKGDFYITTSSIVYSQDLTITYLLFYSWDDGAVLEDLGDHQVVPFVELFGNFSMCRTWDGIPA
jgi:hypothetical protein